MSLDADSHVPFRSRCPQLLVLQSSVQSGQTELSVQFGFLVAGIVPPAGSYGYPGSESLNKLLLGDPAQCEQIKEAGGASWPLSGISPSSLIPVFCNGFPYFSLGGFSS